MFVGASSTSIRNSEQDTDQQRGAKNSGLNQITDREPKPEAMGMNGEEECQPDSEATDPETPNQNYEDNDDDDDEVYDGDDGDDDDDDDSGGDEQHLCSVLGCNAVFQSKRSRDRHSSNVHLHQKLLSTIATTFGDSGLPDAELRPAGEFDVASTTSLAHRSTTSESATWLHDEMKSAAAACIYYMQLRYGELAASVVRQHHHLASPALQCPDCHVDGNPLAGLMGSGGGSPDPAVDSSPGSAQSAIDTAPRPAPDGTAVCHVCGQAFQDNLVLKEHVEKLHPREMFRCTVPGCDKIFSTRKSRNRHSQNDNLHYVIPSSSIRYSSSLSDMCQNTISEDKPASTL